MIPGTGVAARTALFVGLVTLGGWASADTSVQGNGSEPLAPSFQNEVGEAQSLIRLGRYQDAITLLRRADAASQGRCVPCLEGLTAAFAGLQAHRNVADVARRLIALQPDEAVLVGAYERLGLALLAAAPTEPGALEEAAAAFRSELTLTDGEATLARYHLGETLIRQGRLDEGVAELKAFVQRDPTAPEARAARQRIADPSCVLDACAPDVAVLTRAGELVPLSAYRGQVLVLFFWGSWSEFSLNALADLQLVARRFAKKPLAFLAVSGDRDRDAFLQATQGWEYLAAPVSDPESALASSLEIRTWPTTIVVDQTGKIVHRSSGWGSSTAQALQRALRDAEKAAGS